jgi:ABC-type transport system involved in cytochrome c biogenesis ATPase subunit
MTAARSRSAICPLVCLKANASGFWCVRVGSIVGFLHAMHDCLADVCWQGINGAGKTTTLKILSGDIIPTHGTAKLAGLDILTQQIEVRRKLGYCPQFEALFELLTTREHLELYARIKGVPKPLVEGVVQQKLDEVRVGVLIP